MKKYSYNEEHAITIPISGGFLNGFLFIPSHAKGLVLFVHGSGSSRFSSRNQYVAQELNKANHATLLFDLLTEDEESIDNLTRELRFDIAMLASRLNDVTDWCLNELASYRMEVGYFGASTGGGAALVAAAQEPDHIKAIVSRGGRPDMAGDYLPLVKAPTLLIVGGNDEVVIELNEKAIQRMTCTASLEIIPGATHLFEEPGALVAVAQLARNWFDHYFVTDN